MTTAATLEATALDEVCAAIEAHTYRYGSEIQLHDGLEVALTEAGLNPQREVRLGAAGRIDFLAGRVGIEVKVAGEAPPLYRQVTRYARRPELDAILVVTTRRRHATLPREANGKPLRVLVIGGVA